MASTADLDAARTVMEVNLFGAWRMTNALLPLLRRSEHPRVVHISSGAGSHDDEQFGLHKRHGAAAAYGISKAALSALTSTQAAEFVDTPIIVNAVCRRLTATYPGAEAMVPDRWLMALHRCSGLQLARRWTARRALSGRQPIGW